MYVYMLNLDFTHLK